MLVLCNSCTDLCLFAQEVEVHGTVKAGFESVRQLFQENFSRGEERSAQVCVFYRGEKVKLVKQQNFSIILLVGGGLVGILLQLSLYRKHFADGIICNENFAHEPGLRISVAATFLNSILM